MSELERRVLKLEEAVALVHCAESLKRYQTEIDALKAGMADRDKWKQHADSYMADVIILRAALARFYNEFSKSNDFRPDSGVAREVRRELEGE